FVADVIRSEFGQRHRGGAVVADVWNIEPGSVDDRLITGVDAESLRQFFGVRLSAIDFSYEPRHPIGRWVSKDLIRAVSEIFYIEHVDGAVLVRLQLSFLRVLIQPLCFSYEA